MTKSTISTTDLLNALQSHNSGLRLPHISPTVTPSAMCFNIVPLEGIPYHLVTLTTYDANGAKNYKAMSLDKFLNVVTRFEGAVATLTYHLKCEKKEVLDFENVVSGSGNTSVQAKFAASIGVHRFTFVRDSYLAMLLRDLTSEENTQEWKNNGISVKLSYNNI